MFNGKVTIAPEIKEEWDKMMEEREKMDIMEYTRVGGLTREEEADLMQRLNPDITSDEIEEAINKEDEDWENSDEYKQYKESLLEEFKDFDFDFDSLKTQGEN